MLVSHLGPSIEKRGISCLAPLQFSLKMGMGGHWKEEKSLYLYSRYGVFSLAARRGSGLPIEDHKPASALMALKKDSTQHQAWNISTKSLILGPGMAVCLRSLLSGLYPA